MIRFSFRWNVLHGQANVQNLSCPYLIGTGYFKQLKIANPRKKNVFFVLSKHLGSTELGFILELFFIFLNVAPPKEDFFFDHHLCHPLPLL